MTPPDSSPSESSLKALITVTAKWLTIRCSGSDGSRTSPCSILLASDGSWDLSESTVAELSTLASLLRVEISSRGLNPDNSIDLSSWLRTLHLEQRRRG